MTEEKKNKIREFVNKSYQFNWLFGTTLMSHKPEFPGLSQLKFFDATKARVAVTNAVDNMPHANSGVYTAETALK